MPHCISLEVAARTTLSYRYLETSLLVVLQQFDGLVEDSNPLPE